MTRGKVLGFVLALLLAVVLCPCIEADECLYSCSRRVCTAQDGQWEPQIISVGNGGAIVTWYDDRKTGGTDYDIYAQKLSNAGGVWVEDGVNICTAPSRQWFPQITSDGTGGAIIAWGDDRDPEPKLYARRVDGTGNPLWDENGNRVCLAPGEQGACWLVSDEEYGAIVVWTDYRNANWDIYAQRLAGSGGREWPDSGVLICDAPGAQDYLNIARDGQGGVLIAWSDLRTGTTDIYARRVTEFGETLWSPNGSLVCGANDQQYSPTSVSDGAGGAIIAWADNRGATGWKIYAQRMNADGIAMWAPDGIPICEVTGYGQWGPQIVSDGEGGAIIAWWGLRAGRDVDVYAQRVTHDGVVLWLECGVPFGCTPPGSQSHVRMIPDGVGGAIITWQDEGNGPVDTVDVFAQRVDKNGNPIWGSCGVRVCGGARMQRFPAIASDGASGAIIAWEDYRSGYDIYAYSDVYAHHVYFDGQLGVEDIPYAGEPGMLHQNVPNPFNPLTRIEFTLTERSYVSLGVYDVSGKLVRTLSGGNLNAGRHSALWNGEDESGICAVSGVYICRLDAGDFVATRKMVLLR